MRITGVVSFVLALYRIDGGPEMTTGGVIALAFRLGLMVWNALAQ